MKTPTSVRSPGRKSFATAAVLGMTVVLGAYANYFANGFHFDDSHVIEENLYVRSLGNAGRFFTDATTFSAAPANQTYRPLLSLSYALDYRIGGGLDPVAFHVTQLFLHLLVGAGLVLLFSRIMDSVEPRPGNRYLALFAGVFFCVHTANTEAVNYLSSRSDVLSTLGIVGAFVTYLYIPRSRRFHLYLIPMFLGAMAKPPAVMFAPLFFTYLLLFEEELPLPEVLKPESGAKVWGALLRAAPALLLGVLAFFFVEGMNPEAQTYGGAARLDYLRTQPWVWLHYLQLFVIPAGLTADTDWSIIAFWTDARVFAGCVFIGVLVWGTLWTSSVRGWRPVSFGLAWFVLGLLPSSSVFPLAEVANEHRTYLPFAGLVLAAVWTAARFVRERARERAPTTGSFPTVWAFLATLLLGAHIMGTLVRNRVWRTEETLWADVVAKSPENGRAWMNYGLTQMEAGRFEEARTDFLRAEVLSPYYAPLKVNLGIVTYNLGDTSGADPYFLRALELRPNYPAGHYFYGRYLVEAGRAPEAIEQLREAVAQSPSYVPPRRLLLHLYYVMGARDEVEKLAADILDAAPGDTEAPAYLEDRPPISGDAANAYERGVELTRAGQHLEAGVAYRRYLAEVGDDADAYNNLGWSQAQIGLDALAAISFAQAVALRPDDEGARQNLAWIRERMAARGQTPIF
ncbi:MAG: tetratricopeptide repeat protein [Longimicrobiales bacterium]|nr:tetratricopeptide repeat protein [Longimicrobiales bacterium]